MLTELNVQNYALIDKLQVPFKPGLNILTGETGAGKSILIGALGLLMGTRAEADVIRSGAEEAAVSGLLEVTPTSEFTSWLSENSIPLEEGPLILRRVIRPQKRGTIYAGGAPLTRSQLEELTGYLFDLHGQHEHQSLFSTDQQRKLLDRFGQLEAELTTFASDFQELSRRKREWEEFLSAQESREAEMEKCRWIIQEIRKANPQPDEEETLKLEKAKLDQHERLHVALSEVLATLSEDRSAVLTALRRVKPSFETVALIDPNWEEGLRRFETVFYELEDLEESLAAYRRGLLFDPNRLEELNDRLAVLHGLEKRYGPGVEQVLRTLSSAEEKLTQWEDSSASAEKLANQTAEQERLVIQKAVAISERRQAAAKALEIQVVEALADLGMPKARFQIAISRKIGDSGKPLCSIWGLDSVDFLWAANWGEPLRPLRETASGGELSRVMLALKSILSEADQIPILIFDEIDTGIGGEIGKSLGRYLKRLSQQKQVLCVTHLASIAAYADHHLKIEKQVLGERTVTQVQVISGEERVHEIARMLSGGGSSAGLEHARELIASSK